MPEPRFRFTSRLIFGLAVIALGVLFTLDNLGIASAGEALRWWPTLLIAYGVTRVLGIGCVRAVWSGSLFVVAGVWVLFEHLGLVSASLWQLWPVIFIFMGIGIIRKGSSTDSFWGIGRPGDKLRIGIARMRRRRHGVYGVNEDSNLSSSWGMDPNSETGVRIEGGEAGGVTGAAAGAGAGQPGDTNAGSGAAGGATGGGKASGESDARSRKYDDGTRFSADVFMSSVSRKVTSQKFETGEVTAMMGGGDIDLRSARMANESARIEMNLIMSGVNLFVPDDWAVEYQGTPIMGGIEDHSRRPTGAPKGRLVITGMVLMSSIIIKN